MTFWGRNRAGVWSCRTCTGLRVTQTINRLPGKMLPGPCHQLIGTHASSSHGAAQSTRWIHPCFGPLCQTNPWVDPWWLLQLRQLQPGGKNEDVKHSACIIKLRLPFMDAYKQALIQIRDYWPAAWHRRWLMGRAHCNETSTPLKQQFLCRAVDGAVVQLHLHHHLQLRHPHVHMSISCICGK